MEPPKHIIYKKDAEGSPLALAETAYKNEIIQHGTVFTHMDKALSGIQAFPARTDDVWLIEYPKCGVHWVNAIINVLLVNELPAAFAKEERMLEFAKDLQDWKKLDSPRIFNTHFREKDMPEHILKNNKVIFMLRNPKSVAVSYYYHVRNIKCYEYEGTFAGFLPLFLESLDNLYGNWFESVTEYWDKYKDSPNWLWVVYEELKENSSDGVKKISDFLGLKHDLKFCQHVVEQTTLGKMKAKEAAGMDHVSFFKDKEGLCRKGSTTDWKTHFTVAQNEMFDAIYEKKMRDYPDLKEKIRFS